MDVVSYDDWRTAYAEAWNDRLIPVRHQPRTAAQDFSGRVEFRRVRDLELVRNVSTPFAGHKGSNVSAYVGVQVSVAHGDAQVQFRGFEVPRTMTSTTRLWDGGALERFEMLEPGDYFQMLLPRGVIEQRVGRHLALENPVIQKDSALMRVLEGFALSLCHEFSTMQAWEFDAVRNALIELIASLAREVDEESSAAVSDAMLSAVNRWIDQNLLDEQITSGRAASEHGISIRSLHRLFEGQGQSFSAAVRSKRLSRALEDLAATSLSVTTLASKWGYADTSHFCRELKRVHGVTPSEYRRASQTVPAPVWRGA